MARRGKTAVAGLRAALEIVNEHLNEIDLVISDVVMPRMDGPTLIKELRVRRPDLRVVFISGYAEDAFRKRVDAGLRSAKRATPRSVPFQAPPAALKPVR